MADLHKVADGPRRLQLAGGEDDLEVQVYAALQLNRKEVQRTKSHKTWDGFAQLRQRR